MRVHNLEAIANSINKHADSKSTLELWIHEARNAQWDKPQDIKDRYSHASFLSENRLIFNIGGKKYRLEVKLNFKAQVVQVISIKTHAEYNKRK